MIRKLLYTGMLSKFVMTRTACKGQEGELILGSKAEEGGVEPSLEGGKVVSLTRGCGRGCL